MKTALVLLVPWAEMIVANMILLSQVPEFQQAFPGPPLQVVARVAMAIAVTSQSRLTGVRLTGVRVRPTAGSLPGSTRLWRLQRRSRAKPRGRYVGKVAFPG